jgi:cytochrome P450
MCHHGIDSVIEELLRSLNLVNIGRLAEEDIPFGNLQICASEFVTTCMPAGRGSSEFEDSGRLGFTGPPNRHLAFRSSSHRCLESHVVGMGLRAAVEERHRKISEHNLTRGSKPFPQFGEIVSVSLLGSHSEEKGH